MRPFFNEACFPSGLITVMSCVPGGKSAGTLTVSDRADPLNTDRKLGPTITFAVLTNPLPSILTKLPDALSTVEGNTLVTTKPLAAAGLGLGDGLGTREMRGVGDGTTGALDFLGDGDGLGDGEGNGVDTNSNGGNTSDEGEGVGEETVKIDAVCRCEKNKSIPEDTAPPTAPPTTATTTINPISFPEMPNMCVVYPHYRNVQPPSVHRF